MPDRLRRVDSVEVIHMPHYVSSLGNLEISVHL